jgi:exodeoxyribonuclease V alpha subunit
MLDSDVEISIDKASDINSLLLAYALTVHKAQGSEWRKVFFITHQSHATMLQRELLYTAITRAKEELYIICEPEMFVNGIQSQRIKGNTLAEKAEYFKGKVEKEEGTINGK